MLKKTEELIRKKEINGIAVSLYFKLGLIVFTSVFQIVTNYKSASGIIMSLIFVPGIALILFNMLLLRKVSYDDINSCKSIVVCGYLSVFTDIIVCLILPFVWYESVGGDSVSRSYLLRTAMPGILYIMIILNAVSLNPRYIITLAGGGTFIFIFLYFYAVQDSRVVFTDDYLEGILGVSNHKGLYFSNVLGVPIISGLMYFMTKTVKNLIIGAAGNEVVNDRLSRYFSPAIIEKIITDEELVSTQAKTNQAAVLFSDIASFTTLCEKHSPQEMLDFLTSYRELMINAIFRNNGSIDKFIGDGTMALFGLPLSLPNPSLSALQTALELRRDLELFNEKRRTAGLFEVSHRIGIHYGNVVSGNVGNNLNIEYTVIGDTVNTASRLEQFCKKSDTDIVISESVACMLPPEIQTVFIGEEILKGKTKPIKLYIVNQCCKLTKILR